MKLLKIFMIFAFTASLLNGNPRKFNEETKRKLKTQFAGKYIGVVVKDNIPAMSVKGEFGNSAYGTCYININNGKEWKHRRNLSTVLKSLKGRQFCTNCFHKGDLVIVNRFKVKKNSIVLRIVSLNPKKVLKSCGELGREMPEPHSTDMKFTFKKEDIGNYSEIIRHLSSYIKMFTTRDEAKLFASGFQNSMKKCEIQKNREVKRVNSLKTP